MKASKKHEKIQPTKDLKESQQTYRDIAKKTPSARDAWREVDLLEGAEHPKTHTPNDDASDSCKELNDDEKIPA